MCHQCRIHFVKYDEELYKNKKKKTYFNIIHIYLG